MHPIRTKRQQLIKQTRSRQRQQKFAHNRDKLFTQNEGQTIIALVFLMIDRKSGEGQEEITREAFEEFLDVMREEFREYDEGQRMISQKILKAVEERYKQKMERFVECLTKASPSERIHSVLEDSTMFDLVRFLFRVQVIEKNHLQLIDSLLESLIQNFSNLLKQSMNLNQQQNTLQQLYKLVELQVKLIKELLFLHFSIAQKKGEMLETTDQSHFSEKQTIGLLIEKWITKRLVFSFLFQERLFDAITQANSTESINIFRNNLTNLLRPVIRTYFLFLLSQPQYLQRKLFCSKDQTPSSNQKALQFILMLFFSVSHSSKEHEIGQGNSISEIEESIFLYMDLTVQAMKILQNNGLHQGSLLFPTALLNLFVNSYQQPFKKVFFTFTAELDHSFGNMKEAVQKSYNFLIALDSSSHQQCLLIQLLHSIENLEYQSLVQFVQILALLTSHGDKCVQILIEVSDFEGCYDRVLNFQVILKSKLLTHVSFEIRRRALWLLSNITGSEEWYSFGLRFIQTFFLQNALEQDFTSTSPSKQELLVKESIIQVIMNYLSNLRTYEELEKMAEIEKQQDLSTNSQNCNESLLHWIIRIMGSVVLSLTQEFTGIGQSEKFVQVLIYSLYNILNLQTNRKSQHNHHSNNDSQHLILSLMQRHQIPKQLHVIYQKAQTSSHNKNQSNYLTMLETLLDQIQKTKNKQY